MKTIYAFDFDGTITKSDTLLGFIGFVFGKPRMTLGFLLNLPWLVLMKLGLYDNGKTKQRVFSHFFKGMTTDEFNSHCKRFAESHKGIIRSEMNDLIYKLTEVRANIIVVSASIVNWVQPFFNTENVCVIGTEAEVNEGCLTGRFSTPNCYGHEKVRRLIDIRPDLDRYNIVAYGDSRGDRELLAIANVAYYKGKAINSQQASD